MIELVALAAKVATDIGIGTIVTGSMKWMLVPMGQLNTAQKIAVGCAGLVVSGMAVEKANVYIDNQFQSFDEFLKKRKEMTNWTSGGRTDTRGK